MSLEYLEEDAHGERVDTFTKPWSEGTTGMIWSPLTLLEKLAAIVPLPRAYFVRYTGGVAPQQASRRDHPDVAPTGCRHAMEAT